MSAHDGADPSVASMAAMADDEGRRRRLVVLLGHGRGPPADPGLQNRLARVCAVSVSEVGVSGAGITVMGSIDAGLAGARDQPWATGELTRRLEDLQLTAGEGPCLDAYAAGAPVLAGDLATEPTRWLGFGPEAIAAGAPAVFSLPLQVGAVRLGTLDLHRATVGALSREQLADALVLASLATEALLELADAGPGTNGLDGPDDEHDPERWQAAGWLPDVHAEVHVASGMVSARAGIEVGAALLRVRAYAFARGEPIHAVSRRIIDRDLVLDDPGDEPDDGPPAPEVETEP